MKNNTYNKQIFLLLVGFVALIFAVESNAYDTDAYCKQLSEASGGSYQIEKACRDQENWSMAKISSLSIPIRIDTYCEELGQASGGSYSMKEACIRQELQAKSEIN